MSLEYIKNQLLWIGDALLLNLLADARLKLVVLENQMYPLRRTDSSHILLCAQTETRTHREFDFVLVFSAN